MKNNKKNLVLLLVVLAVMAGGIFIYNRLKMFESSPSYRSPQDVGIETTLIDGAGMLEYKSKHNFSIQYPKDWRIDSTVERFDSLKAAEKVFGNHFSIFSYPENDNRYSPGKPVSNDRIKIEVEVYGDISQLPEMESYRDSSRPSVEDWVNIVYKGRIVSEEEIIIDGKSAKKILYKGDRENYLVVVYVDGGKGVRFVSWPKDTKLSKEFEMIVKTFKFTK